MRSRVDIVITDLIMPEMGGHDLGAHIRESFPALPVLFISGYAKDLDRKLEALSDDEYFLAKPFGPSDLARKVREILDSRPPTPKLGPAEKVSRN
jgi:CheY-like chemotaxis protein